MNSLRLTNAIAFISIGLLWIGNLSAQWPIYSDTNLAITSQTGSQTVPLVAATSNGGCFISWYNTASGNYDMYMQYLDSTGTARWDSIGICISNHNQNSWVTDYDMKVDNQDNAILVVNDIRAGGDWDIYAYKIDTAGNFLWGANGLTISNNTVDEYIPQVAVTTNNNAVIVWQADDTICVRKVSPTGQDLWEPPIKKYYSEFGMSFPRVVASDNDCAIVLYLMSLSGGWWPPKNIYTNKLDANGHSLWANDTVAVSNAGGLGPQMKPEICDDGAGGVYCYWYDSRDNNLHAYAQHIKSDGSIAWQTDGVLLSTMSARLQGQPAIAKSPVSPNVMFFFPESDMNQNFDGIVGQCLDSTGAPLWNPEGLELISLGNPSLSSIQAWPQSDGAIIIYKQSPNDVTDCLINALKVDIDGAPQWLDWPTAMSSLPSPKSYLVSDVNVFYQVIAVWEDERNDTNGDIYLQNINPNGTLGPLPLNINHPIQTAPANYILNQNYPNPFNSSTVISYWMPKSSKISIRIFDILGRQVANLECHENIPGPHHFVWNAQGLNSGIYFYRLAIDGFAQETKRMILIK
jgi:hypothetical protein